MVILDPQRGSARIVPFSLAVIAPGPGGAARDHDSDSDTGGGRPGLGPALSSDSDSGLELTASGKADWQDDDQEDDCPDSQAAASGGAR